jgi:hypothetical protein
LYSSTHPIYCFPNEPTGQATLFVDATGTEIGHIIYDAMGAVVTSTLSVTLTQSLAGHMDPTGLQWDGLRYYDPLIGIYAQPNPFGGVPEAPQSLNGYGVASGSMSAAMAQSGSEGLPPLVVDVGKSTIINSGKSGLGNRLHSVASGGLRSIRASSFTKIGTVEANVYVSRVIRKRVPINQIREALLGLGYIGLNRLQGKIPSPLFRAGESALDNALARNSRLIERTITEKVATYQFGLYKVSGSGRVAGFLLSKVGKNALDLGFGLVIDVGYQGIVDYPLWDQGQITGGQYAGRLGVAAIGSGASWVAGLGAGGLVAAGYAAAGLTPPGLVIGGTVFVVGVAANVFFDIKIAPKLFERWGLNPRKE